jgi:hypothetical protein
MKEPSSQALEEAKPVKKRNDYSRVRKIFSIIHRSKSLSIEKKKIEETAKAKKKAAEDEWVDQELLGDEVPNLTGDAEMKSRDSSSNSNKKVSTGMNIFNRKFENLKVMSNQQLQSLKIMSTSQFQNLKNFSQRLKKVPIKIIQSSKNDF